MSLYKNCTWALDPENPAKRFDLRIEKGKITARGENLEPWENEEVFDLDGYFISPGWVDLQARPGAPSYPERESTDRFFQAALAGGFTWVQILPDLDPVVQYIESVWYYKQLSHPTGIRLLVSAASTQNLEGKKMSNLLTLKEAGADSFATVSPIPDAGFMMQLLLYLKHTGKVLMHPPVVPEIARNGQAHDGFTAQNRGLEGIPSVAETIQLYRDLELIKHTGSKIHWPTISTKEAVSLLRNCKSEGISGVSASVAAHQLAFTDVSLDQFDTLYKVLPPFREESDRLALIEGLRDGSIDAVCSDHTPVHQDGKDIEFGNAAFGISSLQTTFHCLTTFAPELSPFRICELLSVNPRKILQMEQPTAEVGTTADFTIFRMDGSTSFLPGNWASSSQNSPFFGSKLNGQVLGVITQNGFQPNRNN